uniref:Uncharacterized protein n=1 Tax=Moniliophthora roreri TaxID=221103 RepID=A0A0W0GAT3_MONRR
MSTPPAKISEEDFSSSFDLDFITQAFFEVDELAVLINKAEALWPFFIALHTNAQYNFDDILRYAGPDDLALTLLCCLAFQPYGPAFIMDWLQLFQSSIEHLAMLSLTPISVSMAVTLLRTCQCHISMTRPWTPSIIILDSAYTTSLTPLSRQPLVFHRPFFHNMSDALCTLVHIPGATLSLPQLPAVCNFFDWQPNQDTFDELHWYTHYVWQALMDLATLWPRTNSPVPVLLASVPSSDYLLDGETYNLTYEADIDTDNLEAWSSMHESDTETKLYSFNDHLGYGEDDLSDLAWIKQEQVADPILPWTPLACSTSPDAAPAPPSPLRTLTLLPMPLQKHLKSQVPFPHDAALDLTLW